MNENINIEQTKLWNKYYILVLLVNALNAFSFYMVVTILSKYLVQIGINITLVGVIVGLFSITSLCVRPLSGLLSDRLNNVTLLKWSNVLMGLGLLGFACTTNVSLIIFFRILNGIGFALGGTSQIVLATKYIPKTRIGEGIGYLGLGMVISSAVAPGIGLSIAENMGMKVTFLISALLTVVAFLVLFIFHEPEKEPDAFKKKISFSDIIAVKALPFTIVAGSYSFINGIIASYLVLYADELGIVGISSYFTVCAVVLFASRPLSGKLMDKKGIRVTVLPGLILTASSMFIIGRSTSLMMILVTGVIRSMGQGAAQPSLQAGCINRVGREKSGVATSTYYLGGDVFQGIGPMLGGVIIGRITGIAGFRTLFDLSGIIMLCALMFFFLVTRKGKMENAK